MIDAITKIINSDLTVNSTNATDLQFNQNVESQTSRENKIKEILSYSDHLGVQTSTEFILIDLISGGRTGTVIEAIDSSYKIP